MTYSIKIILIISLTLINTNSLLSFDPSIFNVLDRSHEYKIRIYFFITYPSCTGCTENINTVIRKYSKSDNIEIAGFISSSDNNIDDKFFKQRYDWNFKIINDMMGIYYQYYKIRKANSLILLDNDGRLLKFIEFNYNPISEIDSIVKQSDLKNSTIENRITDDKIIKSRDKDYLGDNYYLPLWSAKTKKFFLQGVTDKKLIVADSNANVIDIVDFSMIIKFNSPIFRSFSWLIPDSLIIAHCSGIGFEDGKQITKNLLLVYNISDNVYRQIDSQKLLDCMKSYDLKVNYFDNKLILLFNYFSFFVPTAYDTIKPILLVDTVGNKISECGYLPSIYRKHKIRQIYGIFLDFNDNNIFVHYSYSNQIYKYDKNFNNYDTINLEQSPFIRLPAIDYPIVFNPKEILKFANKISIFYDFKYNEISKQFILYFENRESPEGNTDLNSPLIKYSNYFAVFNYNGKLVNVFKIKDRMLRIISFSGNEVTYAVSLQNRIHIKKINFD